MINSSSMDKVATIKKLFKDKYIFEEIQSDPKNKELVKHFSGGLKGKGVELFLKEKAWNASLSGKTKVYLVKYKSTGFIRAYFSIKCGMLYAPYVSETIEGEERDFLELLLEAMREENQELLIEYKAAGLYSDEKFQKLYDEAGRITKLEKEIQQGKNRHSIDVATTYPAIEIENLCKNFVNEEINSENHGSDSKNNRDIIPLGFLVFWVFIVPMIQEIAQKVGCEYIYIFAADNVKGNYNSGNLISFNDEKMTDNLPFQFPLISYYRTNYGFRDADDLFFIRPKYDEKCYEMLQSVEDAINNSKNIWKKFEDILDKSDDLKSIIP